MMKNMTKNQKLALKITILVILVFIIIFFLFLFIKNPSVIKGEFIPPKMDDNYIIGKPVGVSKECIYQEAKVNDEYIVYLCASPLFENNKLNLYFTSSKNNKGLIKIKILDLNNKIIGESGLIEPDSYLKDIYISKKLINNERITVRIMHYEKKTYYSLGELKLDLLVREM